jgi:O-antigen ligase
LGGSTRDDALQLGILQLAALPVLVLGAHALLASGEWRRFKLPLALAVAVVALPLIQLLPLPYSLWVHLPGREDAAVSLSLAGIMPAWIPLSLTPEATLSAGLALLPGLALFVAVLAMAPDRRVLLVYIILAGAALSIALGALQLTVQHPALYPWPMRAYGQVVGLFGNRNHLASLLLMCLPLAAALGAGRHRWLVSNRALSWGAALFSLLAMIALAAIRSRAGVVLFAPAMLLSVFLLWRDGSGASRQSLRLWAAGVLAAVTAVLALGLSPIMDRFVTADGGQGRVDRWPTVLEVAGDYQPLGAGLGSFDPVYRSVETLTELDPTFFNHAHNEYLEIWLETGWLGALLLLVVVGWAGRRWISAWALDRQRRADALARASGSALLLLLLHSSVEFSIRTTAIMAVTAVCLGLLALAGQPNRVPVPAPAEGR